MTYTASAQQPERAPTVPKRSETLIVPVHRQARWILPLGFFLVLTSLVIGLWRAELRLDDGLSSRSPAWVLWGGLGSSIALTTAIALVLWQRDIEQAQARQHLAALESLHATTTAISRDIHSPKVVLRELAESARALLGMDEAGILLLDRASDVLIVAAAASPRTPTRLPILSLDQSPICRAAVTNGKIVLLEDVSRWTGPINREMASEHNVGSLLLIPLEPGGERVGLLAMGSAKPRKFTSSDRRLAELLGAQAAAILANSRLLDQTRSDAEAKAMLLSELNHRVKNNLAAIIGLLSMGEPQLAEPSRRWIERVVERVRAMAEAHELFAGGSQVASLSDLVHRMLPSLTAVGRGNVSIDVRLGTDIRLTPKMAVALGMALHELCFNAIVHGLPDGGAVTIRSLMIASNKIAIDVQDNGRGLGGASPSSGTGLGLKLVEGLVQRELRGSFQISPADGGGTRATIEITADALDVHAMDKGTMDKVSDPTGNTSARELA
ncbi:MAG TPA: GAF domain-containing protein [Humisphaera sp.]|jgi:two-component sensor histidine kinase|nr:GAF domain-containing protein [Humisphaera sp.]